MALYAKLEELVQAPAQPLPGSTRRQSDIMASMKNLFILAESEEKWRC